jgi:hypothetical protein
MNDVTKEEGIEYVPVEEPIEKLNPPEPDEDGDQRLGGGNKEEDKELESAGTEDEREAIRERRKKEKLERKARRDQAIARDKLELEFLRKRNDDLERRFNALESRTIQQDVVNVDTAIKQTREQIKLADEVIAKAISAGNGDDVVKASSIKEEALEKLRNLAGHKAQLIQRPQTNQEPQIDSEVLSYAKKFIGENDWYNPKGGDEDSDIVIRIDRALAQEGLDPRSEEYWEELNKRVRTRFPEKFSNSKERPPRESKGGPQLGGRSESGPTSGRQEVYISPERKQALVEAGVWDDPVLRNKYIKRYVEYDKGNK